MNDIYKVVRSDIFRDYTYIVFSTNDSVPGPLAELAANPMKFKDRYAKILFVFSYKNSIELYSGEVVNGIFRICSLKKETLLFVGNEGVKFE